MKISYIDKKSVIHQLHPVCKILWVLGVLFGSIVISDPFLLFILFLSTVSFALFGKIVKLWFSFVKLALMFSFIIIIINLLASQHGQTILFSVTNFPVFGTIKFSLESLVFGLAMSLRLLSTISAFAIITLTINPDDLMQTILLLKFPYRTVFITTIAIRFIPTLFLDLENLQDSIKTRGYRLNDKNFIRNIKRRSSVISPLLSNSLERSIQSAEAMESRGFGLKGKKTFYKIIKTTVTDYFFIFLSASLFVLFFLIWALQIGNFNYYPTLTAINPSFSYLFTAILLMFFVSAPVIFSPIKWVVDFD